MPATAPATTHLWAFTTHQWLRVRIDVPYWWAAVLTLDVEFALSRPQEETSPSWTRKEISPPTVVWVRHWEPNDDRIKQYVGPADVLGRHDHVHARPPRHVPDQLDVAPEVHGGEVHDGADAALVELAHLPLADGVDLLAVPEMRPVLLHPGRARHDVLVHEGGAEVARVDGAESGLYRGHGALLSGVSGERSRELGRGRGRT